jgi:hypothetical protein
MQWLKLSKARAAERPLTPETPDAWRWNPRCNDCHSGTGHDGTGCDVVDGEGSLAVHKSGQGAGRSAPLPHTSGGGVTVRFLHPT